MIAPIALLVPAGEVVLRARGVTPGYVERYSKQSFRRVETLEVERRFVTDEDGVCHADPAVERWGGGVVINEDGFRGRPFVRPAGGAGRSILFLGDSFTWGIAARPLTNSFVDLVDRAGYVTFNTGIPRAHPKQYAVLAARYVPRLKPDVVAVMFYMGNDLQDAPPMEPFRGTHHQTNAGDFEAYTDDGRYMTAEEAYRYHLDRSNAVAVPSPDDRSIVAAVRRVALATALGTKLLAVLTPNEDEPRAGGVTADDRRRRRVDARAFLASIRDVARRHGAEFRLFLIPVRSERETRRNSIERNLDVFEGFDPLVPDVEFTAADHEPLPGWHFNDRGHRKYAEFVLRALGDGRTLPPPRRAGKPR